MIILETEAPNYLCPERSSATMDSHCRGKECMWWRWFDFKDHRPSNAHGFCGKGGRPCFLEAEKKVEKTGK